MKKHLLVVFAFVSLIGFTPEVSSQTGFNTVLEYCTGTWCQWCPCGHTIIQDILLNNPNTMVLAYHGAGSDPWQTYSQGIRSIFGFSSYPSGVVGRMTGIIERTGWNNRVYIQSTFVEPGVEIIANEFTFDGTTRTVSGLVKIVAIDTIYGNYNINYVLTEDNLIYPQTGNGSCTGGSNYVHDHVVKAMINGDLGEQLNTTDDTVWAAGDTITSTLSYVIPAEFVASNCKVNMFVYKTGGNISSESVIQQSNIESVPDPIGIINISELAEGFNLGQNYPNPFNPSTNIKFSVPKDGNVSLKFFNSIGQEIATYVDGFLKSGIYNATFDGTDLTSGIYFYTLKTDNFVETKKMVLIK